MAALPVVVLTSPGFSAESCCGVRVPRVQRGRGPHSRPARRALKSRVRHDDPTTHLAFWICTYLARHYIYAAQIVPPAGIEPAT